MTDSPRTEKIAIGSMPYSVCPKITSLSFKENVILSNMNAYRYTAEFFFRRILFIFVFSTLKLVDYADLRMESEAVCRYSCLAVGEAINRGRGGLVNRHACLDM